MVQLPTPVPSASGWGLSDYRWLTAQSSPAAADGRMVVELEQLDPDEMWLVDQAVVTTTSSTPTSARYYAGGQGAASLIDGTASGNFDVGWWPNGLLIEASTRLLVVWDGASLGAVATWRGQLRVLRKG